MSVTTQNEGDILSRVIAPEKPALSPDAARSILELSFNADDVARMNELSRKASTGTLTPDEQEELNSFERVGHLLAILQSKARASLKNVASKPSDS